MAESRISGLRLHAAVCASTAESASIVFERMFEPGATVTIGGSATDGLVVPGWTEASLLLITEGELLHLAAGMRINMCHDGGADHVIGTFEALSAQGLTWPHRINVSHLTIRVRDGISVFAKYVSGPSSP